MNKEKKVELPEHLKQFANFNDIWDLPKGSEFETRAQILDRITPLNDPYKNLPQADKDILNDYWKQKRKIIYKDLYENDILKLFDKSQEYGVNDIAAKLGLNYVQAYRYIVPFLMGKGYRIGKGGKTSS